MKTYLALVEKDEDSAFGLRFPDVPGCFSAVNGESDILPHVVEALELWFNDAPATEPRPLHQIAAECADELAKGAFLITVPLVRRSTRQRRVNVSLDAIDTTASQLGLTR